MPVGETDKAEKLHNRVLFGYNQGKIGTGNEYNLFSDGVKWTYGGSGKG